MLVQGYTWADLLKLQSWTETSLPHWRVRHALHGGWALPGIVQVQVTVQELNSCLADGLLLPAVQASVVNAPGSRFQDLQEA